MVFCFFFCVLFSRPLVGKSARLLVVFWCFFVCFFVFSRPFPWFLFFLFLPGFSIELFHGFAMGFWTSSFLPFSRSFTFRV